MLSDEFWTVYAHAYGPGVTTLKPYEMAHAEVMSRLRLHGGMRVVDAGCGTAYYGASIARRMQDAKVIGLEKNPGMFTIAREQAREIENLTVLRHDLEADPWPEKVLELDAVLSINVLYTLGGPKEFLSRAHKALKPGGQLLLTNMYRPDMRLVFGEHLMWRLMEATPEELEADDRLRWARKTVIVLNQEIAAAARGSKLSTFPPDQLQQLVESVGFTVRDRLDTQYAGTAAFIDAVK